MRPLEGKVAVVAGATRGAGRGIACALGEAGATVFCTGRSTKRNRRARRAGPFDLDARPETIDETAALVEARGGVGIPVRVDHTREPEVRALFAKVARTAGRLDLLVDDVWGGDALVEWGKPFWTLRPDAAKTLLERAIFSHVLTCRYAVPLLVSQRSGLVVEVTDGHRLEYRGQLHYDLVKTTIIRLAFAMAEELRPHGVAAVAVTPGFLRSEAMLDHFGVTEADWRNGAETDPHFIASETPLYVGRGIAALAADPKVLASSGRAFSSADLARRYRVTDADGRRPDFERHLVRAAPALARERTRGNARYLAGFRRDPGRPKTRSRRGRKRA